MKLLIVNGIPFAYTLTKTKIPVLLTSFPASVLKLIFFCFSFHLILVPAFGAYFRQRSVHKRSAWKRSGRKGSIRMRTDRKRSYSGKLAFLSIQKSGRWLTILNECTYLVNPPLVVFRESNFSSVWMASNFQNNALNSLNLEFQRALPRSVWAAILRASKIQRCPLRQTELL